MATTQTTSLRLALVGCGAIAKAHWRGIRELAPRIDVTATVDIDRRRAQTLANRIGCKAFGSLEEALASDRFDAVDIMVPHDRHEELAKAALKAGKHVCLEKPLANDLPAAKRILAAAKRAAKTHGTVCMVAEQSQYWPDVVMAADLIKRGAIGQVIHARACYYDWFKSDEIGLGPVDASNWRFSVDTAGGGICLDGGSHWIRPLRMMLGDITSVVAVTGRHVQAMEGETHASAILRCANGATASFEAFASHGVTAPTEDFRITGTEGELVLEHRLTRRGYHAGRLLLYNAETPDGDVLLADNSIGTADSYGIELDDFSRAVLDGTPLAAPPEAALGELRTAMALYRSAESGRWEKV